MAATPGERIATNEQRIADLTRRLDGLERELEEVASRNRKTEWAVSLIVDAQRKSQQTVVERQRRLEIRINVLIGVAAVAAVLLSIVQAVVR